MPTIVENDVASNTSISRLNVDQYFHMIKTGVIREGAPFELLDGVLVFKDRSARGEKLMSIGPEHTFAVLRLAKLDSALSKAKCHMRHQAPVALAENQAPEPDGAIVKGTEKDFITAPPTAVDVLCVIEVADASLNADRTTKLRIYAATGIFQFVIVNLVDRVVEVREKPDALAQKYTSLATYKSGQSIPFFTGRKKRLDVPVDFLISK